MRRDLHIAQLEIFAERHLGLDVAEFGTEVATARHVTTGLACLQARGAHLPPRVRIIDPAARLTKPENLTDEGWQIAALYTPYEKPLLEIDPGTYAYLVRHPDPEHVCTGPFSTLTHECGHHAHWHHAGDEPYLALAALDLTPAQRRTARRVSRAAGADVCEFVAETWVGLSAGRSYPTPVLTLYLALDGPPPLEPEPVNALATVRARLPLLVVPFGPDLYRGPDFPVSAHR